MVQEEAGKPQPCLLAVHAVCGISFPAASVLALRHFLSRLLSASVKWSLPHFLLQSSSAGGGNRVTFTS